MSGVKYVIFIDEPHSHEAYTRIQHGKAQYIAPKGIKKTQKIKAPDSVMSVMESEIKEQVEDPEAFGLTVEEVKDYLVVHNAFDYEKGKLKVPSDVESAKHLASVLTDLANDQDAIAGDRTKEAEERRFARFACQGFTSLSEKVLAATVKKSIRHCCISESVLAKSTSHERFYSTVMTMPGRVKKIKEGRFGAREVVFDNGVKAVLKPKLFSNEKFRGIPKNTQYAREAAAYQFDRQIAQFGVTPPTTLTVYETLPSSIQSWVTGVPASGIVTNLFDKGKKDWKERIVKFASKVDIDKLRKLVILDLMMNNTDRHAKNCKFDTFSEEVWGIDNGLCFGRYFEYYNNVFHRYLFIKKLELLPDERRRLEAVTLDQIRKVLDRYLSKREIEETYWRVQWVLEQPNLGYERIAPDSESKNDFPSYKKWFATKMRKEPKNKILSRVAEMGIGGVVDSAVA